MKERGILFSAPMVRSLLADVAPKTQTRRTVKLREFQPSGTYGYDWDFRDRRGLWNSYTTKQLIASKHNRYGVPGDRLWVRETHAQFSVGEGMDRAVPQCVAYRATCGQDGGFDYVNGRGEIMRLKVTKWTPAIHMPRFAARCVLEIADVRVQRLQDISEEDARAEGVAGAFDGCKHLGGYEVGTDLTCRAAFEILWKEINGRESWESNPWVWAISFRRLS